jgi:hypothetical protein
LTPVPGGALHVPRLRWPLLGFQHRGNLFAVCR